MIHRLKFPTKASFTKAINALYPLDDEGNRTIPRGEALIEIGIMNERTDDPEAEPVQLDGYHADIVIPELPENLEKYVVEPNNPQHTVAGL